MPKAMLMTMCDQASLTLILSFLHWISGFNIIINLVSNELC